MVTKYLLKGTICATQSQISMSTMVVVFQMLC